MCWLPLNWGETFYSRRDDDNTTAARAIEMEMLVFESLPEEGRFIAFKNHIGVGNKRAARIHLNDDTSITTLRHQRGGLIHPYKLASIRDYKVQDSRIPTKRKKIGESHHSTVRAITAPDTAWHPRQPKDRY